MFLFKGEIVLEHQRNHCLCHDISLLLNHNHIISQGNFMCDECGVPYNTKSTLRQHKMAVHPSTNGGQSYPCLHPGCSKVFKVAAKLRMHVDVVHKNLEGKYKCNYCPKRFHGKSSLKEHTNGVHLNTKPHKCSICDFSSAYRSKWYSALQKKKRTSVFSQFVL